MGLGLDTAMAGTVILSPLLMGIFLCLVLTIRTVLLRRDANHR